MLLVLLSFRKLQGFQETCARDRAETGMCTFCPLTPGPPPTCIRPSQLAFLAGCFSPHALHVGISEANTLLSIQTHTRVTSVGAIYMLVTLALLPAELHCVTKASVTSHAGTYFNISMWRMSLVLLANCCFRVFPVLVNSDCILPATWAKILGVVLNSLFSQMPHLTHGTPCELCFGPHPAPAHFSPPPPLSSR